MTKKKIDEKHKCPVCGKFEFPHRLSQEICEVCGWQDDIFDEDDPDEFTGANEMELAEYREAYASGWRPFAEIDSEDMKGAIQYLTEEQLDFIEREFGFSKEALFSLDEDSIYDDVYDKCCDIEIEETIDALDRENEEITDRGRIASDIVTLLGNTLMEDMTADEIVDVMADSWGHNIRYIDLDGDEWFAYCDNYESRYDNEDDEITGACIFLEYEDGDKAIVYEHGITFIEILD